MTVKNEFLPKCQTASAFDVKDKRRLNVIPRMPTTSSDLLKMKDEGHIHGGMQAWKTGGERQTKGREDIQRATPRDNIWVSKLKLDPTMNYRRF